MSKPTPLSKSLNDFNPRGLMARYIFALALIFLFIAAGHFASVSMVETTEESSNAIAASVNQKTRITRILAHAEFSLSMRSNEFYQEMRAEIDALERAHEELVEVASRSDEVGTVYFTGADWSPPLDAKMRAFIADARLIAEPGAPAAVTQAAAVRLRSAGFKVLPQALQRASEAHQSNAKAHAENMNVVKDAAFLFAVLGLIIEAVFIFLPADRAVRRAFEELSAQAGRLKEAHAALEARNGELEELRASAEREAVHDPLTGLANRRGFDRAIEGLRSRALADGTGVAVLHIDLDRFKQINDTLGHAAGDHVLRHVGQTLRESTREGDFVARIGGDEFIVAQQNGGDRAPLGALAARIVERLSQPIRYEGQLCQFGASVGIAIALCDRETADVDLGRLLENADAALYHAKGRGRGRYEFFSENLGHEVDASRRLAIEVAPALQDGAFFPHYQPQFDARSGEIVGVEALARWRRADQGVLAAEDFLTIVERQHAMADLDDVIHERARRDLEAWDALGLSVPQVSLNVSVARLRDPRLAATLALDTHQGGRFAFELAESLCAADIDDAARFAIDLLDERGVAVEIDGFGAGDVSLMAIHALKPTRLKVAREIVAELPGSDAHRALVASICQIAKALRIGVTADGVETEVQRALLIRLGCDRLQGALLAAPMSADAFGDLLTRQVARATA